MEATFPELWLLVKIGNKITQMLLDYLLYENGTGS